MKNSKKSCIFQFMCSLNAIQAVKKNGFCLSGLKKFHFFYLLHLKAVSPSPRTKKTSTSQDPIFNIVEEDK